VQHQDQNGSEHDADQVDHQLQDGLDGRPPFAGCAATTANAAAGTVVTEMNTPTKAADLAEVKASIPAAPASSARIKERARRRR